MAGINDNAEWARNRTRSDGLKAGSPSPAMGEPRIFEQPVLRGEDEVGGVDVFDGEAEGFENGDFAVVLARGEFA